MTISTHVVHARNWATTSANRIHSDDIAGQYGFRGGLVPGVTSIAYTIPAVVAALGEEWLCYGTPHARLTSPVYDEEVVKVVVDDGGRVRLVGQAEDDDRLIATATVGPTDLGFEPGIAQALEESMPQTPPGLPGHLRASNREQEVRAPATPPAPRRSVPEPASILLLVTGLIGLAARRHLLRNRT